MSKYAVERVELPEGLTWAMITRKGKYLIGFSENNVDSRIEYSELELSEVLNSPSAPKSSVKLYKRRLKAVKKFAKGEIG